MDKTEMLPEMVFPVECAVCDAFLFACTVVVRFEMLFCGVDRVTKDTLLLARRRYCDYFAQWSTYPLFKTQMQ
jgi:hypothetical protein